MKKVFMNVVENRLTGIAITIVGLIAIILLAYFGLIPPSTPLGFLVVVLSAFIGGRWVGVGSAIAVGAFSQLMFGSPGGWGRLIVLYACAIATGFTVGYLRYRYRLAVQAASENQWKADLVDAVNGNLRLLERIHKRLEDLFRGWNVLSDDAKLAQVDAARGEAAQLRTMAQGWRAMAEERERLKREHDRERGE